MSSKSKTNKQISKPRVSVEQHQANRQRILFIVLSVIIVLAMVASVVATL